MARTTMADVAVAAPAKKKRATRVKDAPFIPPKAEEDGRAWGWCSADYGCAHEKPVDPVTGLVVLHNEFSAGYGQPCGGSGRLADPVPFARQRAALV